jgi:hypothetical protein
MKKGSLVLLSLVTLLFTVVSLSCGLFDTGGSGTKTAYVYIPGATFHQGSAPVSKGTNSAKRVVATPSSHTLSTSTPVTWTVTWDVSIEVETIIVYEESMDGYFEITPTADEITNDSMEFEQYVTETEPDISSTCGCHYGQCAPCYGEPSKQTTTADAEVSFVGSDTSVGTYVNVSISFDFVWVEPDTGNGDYGDCYTESGFCNCTVSFCAKSSGGTVIGGYLVGSTWYQCASSTNCTSAATAVVNACCPH